MTPTLSLEDVLSRLQISPSGYYKLRAEGRWPFSEILPRIGRRARFRLADIERWERGEWQTTKPRRIA
jgi:predicted DNA-binding transcriptional regulator AlpA